MTASDREADALDGDVEAFFSELIHDLRNVLDGVSMMLPRDSASTTERSLSEVTFRNVYDVLRKTEDFRDRRRGPTRAHGSAELGSSFDRVLRGLEPFVRERNVVFESAGEVWVGVDGRALRRILENIVHVLAKRTTKGDTIRVAPADSDIDDLADDVALTFETAKLATATTTDELFPSSFKDGVDLWASRETMRLLGGDIICAIRDDGVHVQLTLPKHAPAGGASDPPATKRILVVDDNVDTAKSLVILLSSAGFETELCGDGASAIETVSSSPPDAVVLDLGLPDIDGCEVCRRLRAEPGGDRMLVLAVSGHDDPETLSAVDDAGFDEHFVKPVDHKRLIHRLSE